MKDIKVWLIFIKWMSLQFKNVNKKYKLKNKLSIIRNILIVKMLRLEPSPHYLNKFL